MMKLDTAISQDVKDILLPLITTALLVGFIILAFNTLLGQISAQMKALGQAKVLVNTLAQKEAVLRENQSRTGQYLSVVLPAYPEDNPSLQVLTSISDLSAANQVLSGGFTMSGSSVTFNLKGELAGMITFLKQLNSISPVVTLTSVNISSEAGAYSADVSLKLYWEAYPSLIPAVNSPLEVLTGDEVALLSNLPQRRGAGRAVIPQGPYQRVNPF